MEIKKILTISVFSESTIEITKGINDDGYLGVLVEVSVLHDETAEAKETADSPMSITDRLIAKLSVEFSNQVSTNDLLVSPPMLIPKESGDEDCESCDRIPLLMARDGQRQSLK